MDDETVVAYAAKDAVYPESAPFNPGSCYPEYGFAERSDKQNVVYEGVRECFHLAGLDSENYGRPDWNPLKRLINSGETVLLKPNMVKEHHPRDPEGWRYILTHGSVIRAVADYVWLALRNRGKIIIADAPQTDSSFTRMVEILGLDVLRDFYGRHGLDVELIDLRQEEWINRGGVIVDRRRLAGDPYGAVAFDLAENSEFFHHRGAGRYYGADYDIGAVNTHHSNGRHEYLMAGCAIKSDVIFNLPKLKTHKKAGITVSLKNLVGVNADKNWLPHHTEGPKAMAGDEHPDPSLKHKAERVLASYFWAMSLRVPTIGTRLHRNARVMGAQIFGDTEEVIRSGNWWGNDTLWRMCLDLNKLILYGNPDGSIRMGVPGNRKRHYSLVDGIVGGEGRGPINSDPVNAGVLLFGTHAVSVDAACAWLMGFDPERIPIVRQAFKCHQFPLAEWDWSDVEVLSNRAEWQGKLADIPDQATFHFRPHFGWINQLERAKSNDNLIGLTD